MAKINFFAFLELNFIGIVGSMPFLDNFYLALSSLNKNMPFILAIKKYCNFVLNI
jgi:hypothetical protein